MEKISHQENIEYTYDSEEQRAKHVDFMVSSGWNVGSKSMRVKEGTHISNATDDDYEWYAEYWVFRN